MFIKGRGGLAEKGSPYPAISAVLVYMVMPAVSLINLLTDYQYGYTVIMLMHL